MLCASREFLLLCSVLIIQHVIGSCQNFGCCNYGTGNYGGWNGYQNWNQFYRRLANGGGNSFRNGWSVPLSGTSGSERWTNQGTGTRNRWINPTSNASPTRQTAMTGNPLTRLTSAGQVTGNGAGDGTWNTPNTFGEYPRWNSQTYGTTSSAGLTSITNTAGNDGFTYAGLDTLALGTNPGPTNIRRNTGSGYNGRGTSNRVADDGILNSLNYRTTSYDGVNNYINRGLTATNNAGYFNGRIGSTNLNPINVVRYTDFNSLGGAVDDDGSDSLVQRTGYRCLPVTVRWDVRRRDGYDGVNGQSGRAGYDRPSILADRAADYYGLNDQVRRTGTWYSITPDAASASTRSQNGAAEWNWNTVRTAAGYNPLNNMVGDPTVERPPQRYSINNAAVSEEVYSSTRGDPYEGLVLQAPRILCYDGWNSDGSGTTFQDRDGNIYEVVLDEFSNYDSNTILP